MAESIDINVDGFEEFNKAVNKLGRLFTKFNESLKEPSQGRSAAAKAIKEEQIKSTKAYASLLNQTARSFGLLDKQNANSIKTSLRENQRKQRELDRDQRNKDRQQKLADIAAKQQDNIVRANKLKMSQDDALHKVRVKQNKADIDFNSRKRKQELNQSGYDAETIQRSIRAQELSGIKLEAAEKRKQMALDLAKQVGESAAARRAREQELSIERRTQERESTIARRSRERAEKRMERRWWNLEKWFIKGTMTVLRTPFTLVGKAINSILGTGLNTIGRLPGMAMNTINRAGANEFFARSIGSNIFTPEGISAQLGGLVNVNSLMSNLAKTRADTYGVPYARIFGPENKFGFTTSTPINKVIGQLVKHAYNLANIPGNENLQNLMMNNPELQVFDQESLQAMRGADKNLYYSRADATTNLQQLTQDTDIALSNFNATIKRWGNEWDKYFSEVLNPMLPKIEHFGKGLIKFLEKFGVFEQVDSASVGLVNGIDRANALLEGKAAFDSEKTSAVADRAFDKIKDGLSYLWGETKNLTSYYWNKATESTSSILKKEENKFIDNHPWAKDVINKFDSFKTSNAYDEATAWALRFKKDTGYSNEIVASIFGNIFHESGGLKKFKGPPNKYDKEGPSGWLQLNADKRIKFEKNADSRGWPREAKETQYQTLLELDRTDPDFRKAIKRMGGQDIEADTDIFERVFEKSGDASSLKKRRKHAIEIEKRMNQLEPQSSIAPLSYPNRNVAIRIDTRGISADTNISMSGMPGVPNGGIAFANGLYSVG